MKSGLTDPSQSLIVAFILHVRHNPFRKGRRGGIHGSHGSDFGRKAAADKFEKSGVGEQDFSVFFDRKYDTGQGFAGFGKYILLSL